MSDTIGQVEAKLGGAPLVMRLDGLDVPAAALGATTIRRGRSGSTESPAPAQLTAELDTAKLAGRLPSVGSKVELDLAPAFFRYLGFAPLELLTAEQQSFEAGTIGGWSNYGAAEPALSNSVPSSPFPGAGVRCLQITWTAGSSGSNAAAGTPLVTTAVGKRYELRMQVRVNLTPVRLTLHAPTGAGGATQTVTLDVPASGATVELRLATPGPTTGPGTIQGRFTPTAAAVAGAWVRVDDVHLVELDSEGASSPARPRFRGTVTDLQAVPATSRSGPRLSLVAVGPKRLLGTLSVTQPVSAQELDGARAGRLLTLAKTAHPALVLGTHDAGTQQVAATTASRPDVRVGQALADLESWTGGTLVETRAGELVWKAANARQLQSPVAELVASDLLAPLRWKQSLEGLVNTLTGVYRRPTSSDPEATARIINPPRNLNSRTLVGPFEAEFVHDLPPVPVGALDASAVYNAVLSLMLRRIARRSKPRWRTDSLAVELLRTLSPAKARALLEAEFGASVIATGLPSTGPLVAGLLYLEGATESYRRDSVTLQLDVTDYADSGPETTWSAYPAGTFRPVWDPVLGAYPARRSRFAWSDFPASLDWFDAITYRPDAVTNLDRWRDQAAGTTWSTRPATQTWAAS